MSRPRVSCGSKMILTDWQRYVETLLDKPVNYDSQEREFHWFADFVGKVGKSMLVKHLMATRDDCLVISSTGKMSDLVCSVKEKLLSSSKIRAVIFDLPRQATDDKNSDIDFHLFDDLKHDGDTIAFMESCVNGRFTSMKYESLNFPIDHGLKVVVFSNSLPLITMSSLDRWHINIIKNQDHFQLKDLTYSDDLPRITTKKQVIDFYLSQVDIREYLQKNGLSTTRRKKFIHDLNMVDRTNV
jgi:hypothetical protein